MEKYIDLHIHSTYSDGRYSPDEIVRLANDGNVGLISITDHDTIDAYKQTQLLSNDAINVINGIEISSLYTSKKNKNVKIHILGYDFNLHDSDLNIMLDNLKSIRYEINKKYVIDLRRKFTYIPNDIVTLVDCEKYYRIGWAIIQALKVLSISEEKINVVNKYVWHNYPIYSNYDIPANKVIEIIKNANGIPIIAHPYSYHLNDLEIKRMIRELINLGIEGIEAYHSECSLENMKKLRMLAESYKVLYSCGSDFHFPTGKDNKIIGYGIDNNLCKTECSLASKVLCLNQGGKK